MLWWRTATALVLAPVALAAIVMGKWAVLALVFLVVAGAAYELSEALQPLPFVAALGAGALPVIFSIPYSRTGILAGAMLSLPWALFWLAGKPEIRTLRVVIAVFGPWISDSGAYFAGHLFGRRLHFPSLSPNKTVEGSLGGLLLTILVVGFASYLFLGFSPVKAVVIGAGVSVFSQSGDLFESTLKRILDVKDLGHFLPGHGGILDRIDSLLFTAPAVYYISLLV